MTVRSADNLNIVSKHIMTSLLDPPCLTEQTFYVENAVGILHTFSTGKWSSNERLRAVLCWLKSPFECETKCGSC